MYCVWQMNTGDWWISALGGRASLEIAADAMRLWRAGLEIPFETKAEAEAALKEMLETGKGEEF